MVNVKYKYTGVRKMDKKLINIAQILSDYCDNIDCDSCPFDHIVSDDCRCPVDRTRSALREILQENNTLFDRTEASEPQIESYDTEAEYYFRQYELLRSLIKDLAEKAEFDVSEKPEPILDTDDDDE